MNNSRTKNPAVVITFLFSLLPLAALSQEAKTSADSEPLAEFHFNTPLVSGPFKPTAESLKTYQAPEWFRDAKFGIWAHWGPQAVPRAGDWYARNMYVPGTSQYAHHLKNYGHPSEQGYKDIIALWHAEKFDPDALMQLYVKAGAKYFVSMGVHHDNFDLWNSKYHSWNAVKMGPKRDIVGEWQQAAKKYKLPFGVSEHLGASYGWFAPSHGYDQFWPKQGISYDGANPAYSELYHTGKDTPYRDGKTWYTNNPESQQEWFNRINDLISHYQPDLLYTDGGIPFGDVGKTLVANLYNNSVANHHGKNEAVYNHKEIGSGEFIREAGVQDVERGGMEKINPLPWQTDTSIGDWFYSEGYKYKTTSEVVHTLTDVVSKNGNLLLNVVLYADGSLPPEPRQFLDEMASWITVNGDAIYGTRPWKIFGEGPTKAAGGHFKEADNYTAQDIRFTTKGSSLYAITLGVPQHQVHIESLGAKSVLLEKKIRSVKLLGSNKPLKWKQEAAALVIEVPDTMPTLYSSSFKIDF